MKNFDFDKINERRNTSSYKWDSSENPEVIPLWVADMDFRTAPCIIDALKKRVEQGIFGYTKVPDDYYHSTINWFSTKHGFFFQKEWMIYTSGVVPAISAIIKALTKPGDKVIVQTPVYNCFFSSIRNNDCIALENKLIYKDNTYYIDFDNLEEICKDEKATLMLVCNPHNPAGKVWSKEELGRINEICLRNNIKVVSDEIHCELVYSPYIYTPFGSISEETCNNSVTCVSPSKAFNIAGLQIANIICKNEEWRAKIDKAININEVCDVNPFGVIATIKAYTEGEEWLNELLDYLWSNYQFLKHYFETYLPQIPVLKLEGTYLVWIDCRVLGKSSDELEEILLKKGQVWLNSGTMYGKTADGFMRINIACPKSRLHEGLERIRKVFDSIK